MTHEETPVHQQPVVDPDARPTQDPQRPRPWILALVLVAVVVVLLLTVLRGDPDPEVANDDRGSEPAASGEDPTSQEGLVVGDTATMVDGAVARVNGVEPDVTLDPGLPGPEPGTRLDRLDVELCAGTSELFVDAALWLGTGDDQKVHSSHMGVRDLLTLTMAPGTCQRGTVELAMPDGVQLDEVLLADEERQLAARWAVDRAPAEDSQADPPNPLQSEVAPDAAAQGESVTAAAGGTVTLHGAATEPGPDEDAAAGADTTVFRIDGERCAGAEVTPTSPRDWLVQLDDNRLIGPERDGATMLTGELDPAACDRGTADFHVPAGAQMATVIYTYGSIYEEARWHLDR